MTVQTLAIFRRVCAWCGKDMGEFKAQGIGGTTHGICTDCYQSEIRKLDVAGAGGESTNTIAGIQRVEY